MKAHVCDLHPDRRMQDSVSCQAVFPKRNLSSCMHCIDPLFSHDHDPVNTSNYHGNTRSLHLQPAIHIGMKLYALSSRTRLQSAKSWMSAADMKWLHIYELHHPGHDGDFTHICFFQSGKNICKFFFPSLCSSVSSIFITSSSCD